MKLDWKTAGIAIALALTLLPTTTATAQDRREARPTKPSSAPSARRGKSAPRAQAPVTIPLGGVPAEAVTVLLADLRALTREVYACPTCKLESLRSGACSRCSGELTAAGSSELVARVEIPIDRRFLSITLNPHQWASIAEIDALLAKSGAKVRRDRFRLPQYARLLVSGVAAADAGRVRAALIDLKVVPAVTVVPAPEETDSRSVWVMPKNEKASVTVAAIDSPLNRSTQYVNPLDRLST